MTRKNSKHHECGVQCHDHANWTLVDMRFGNLRDPPAFACETGYWHGAAAHFADMLLSRDLSSPHR